MADGTENLVSTDTVSSGSDATNPSKIESSSSRLTNEAALALEPKPWLVAWSLARREVVRFLRQRHRVFGALGQPIIFWMLFSEGLKPQGLDYEYFFPGTLAMILLFTAIFATISIIEDRKEGFLQSVLVAPIPRWSMVFGKILGGALLAILQGVIFLILGLVTQQVDASFLGLLGSFGLMVVISFALTALGFFIAWRMDSTQGFHAVMSVFLFPMWLLSGAFFPAKTGWLGWLVKLNPLTYGVSGLRVHMQQSGETLTDEPSLLVCWAVSILFAVVMFGLCCWIAGRRTRGDLL